MLKLIDKIEKSKAFWSLLVILFIFFVLRLPSVIEPNWYGDEGIYQVLGMSVNEGRMLYKDAWDNKPPLLYLTYAAFHGDHLAVRFFSLIVGIITTGVFFILSQTVFKNIKTSIATTTLFTLLFATPIIEGNIANAENFMLLPIILAAFLIYKTVTHETHKPFALRPLLLAGLLLGLAFLFKIVALFDFAALFMFVVILSLPEKLSFSAISKILTRESQIKNHASRFTSLLHNSFFMILGFLLPIGLTFIYFALNKALPDFIQAVFSGMFGYVGYANTFIIPQGFLIVKLLLLMTIISVLVFKRNTVSKPVLFVFLWLSFSLFNAFFSQRPYIHYMLVLVPSFCLLFGLVINAKTRKSKLQFSILLFLVIVTIFTTFKTYSLKKTMLYYQNTFLFVTNQKDISAYQSFFDRKTPRDYQLASFLQMHIKPEDSVFIWGDSAQIYALSRTLPITKYTVAYHIRQNPKDFKAIEQTLNTTRPKYVIILAEAPNFPFHLEAYTSKFSLERATVYESAL